MESARLAPETAPPIRMPALVAALATYLKTRAPTRKATKPAPAMATLWVSHSFFFAKSATPETRGPIKPSALLSGGKRTLPTVMPSLLSVFFSNWILLAVVSARTAYSFCIDPAYLSLSETVLSAFW